MELESEIDLLVKTMQSLWVVVTIDGDYFRKHGKRPSGKKKWVFRIGDIKGIEEAELYGLPVEMEFGAAVVIAKEVALRLGFRHVYVEP